MCACCAHKRNTTVWCMLFWPTSVLHCMHYFWWARCQDSLAEWSKALASGASPQGRGFEPHSCHFVNPLPGQHHLRKAMVRMPAIRISIQTVAPTQRNLTHKTITLNEGCHLAGSSPHSQLCSKRDVGTTLREQHHLCVPDVRACFRWRVLRKLFL